MPQHAILGTEYQIKFWTWLKKQEQTSVYIHT